MGAIHRDDEVAVLQLRGGELAGTVGGAVESAGFERYEGALICTFSDVPITGSGARRHNAMRQARPLRVTSKNDLGHGGAANIAGTHEDNAKASVVRGHSPILSVPRRDASPNFGCALRGGTTGLGVGVCAAGFEVPPRLRLLTGFPQSSAFFCWRGGGRARWRHDFQS